MLTAQKESGEVGSLRLDPDSNLIVNPLRLAGEDPDGDYIAVAAAGNYTRIYGVTTPQTIKTAPGIVHRVIINVGVANAIIALRDGPSTDVAAITLPDSASRVIEVGAVFGSDIRIVPSNPGLDFTVIWR